MSYQVLARKWRPHNFSQVVGQQHVLTALSNGLAQNRVHHAYLFSGTRGVGKTTIARILAKSLNCEKGVTATPCGKCENCVAIDQGRFVDLLEIDAASRTKVDDTRELLDNVQYKPAVGRYKVYLIDEVHMLSKHSFNALLKTLEEPPEYVKFLLATTDPQKLPITVLSRCLQFHLKAILPEQIEAQLALILQHEQATFEHSALSVIAKAADGSMRDALSLTDQALAFGNGNIDYQSVLKMVGTLDNSHLHYLLHFIVSGNVTKVFAKIEEFVVLGADFAKLHQELATLCHQIALEQLQAQPHSGEKSAIQLLSERLTPEEVQLYYQIALQGYKDYAFAPNGKIALEMTVMRLLAFKPANYIELDETLLINKNTHDESEPEFAPVIQAIEPIVEEITAPAEHKPLVVEQTPVFEPTNIIEQPIVPEFEPQTFIEQQPVEAIPEQQVVTTSEQVPVESISQVTHSRNMLRSHRLKRNETKKPQATTDHHLHREPVVAALPTVARIIDGHIDTTIDSAIKIPFIEPPPIEEPSKHHVDIPAEIQNVVEPMAIVPSRENINSTARVKHPYFSDQAFEAVTIDTAKYVEDKLTDPWSLAIQKMGLVGLVKLLAKNSVMKKNDQQITLTLKVAQQHLLNDGSLCETLQAQLKSYYGAQTNMYIEVGNAVGELTAFESEMALYDQYLNNAKHAIVEDENIKALVVNCGAKVYENSVIPL
ncbi:DNA polymerase III subunit gamma/tau [Psychromonas hadalis]|uniref:DNA polymerase III subunit gamma/tau n=1 Tax=Psychromonas hadalis TaxID=211669 RepID=UPI0003B50D4E|nr:DNA polymerase III subunit gamma/tau [Psychromonas hadalis]